MCIPMACGSNCKGESKNNSKNILVKIFLCLHEKSLYGFWHIVKLFTMGREHFFTVVNMKFRNIFCVFTGYLWWGFWTSESSNFQVRPPSLEILALLWCLSLINHVHVDAELWSGSEGKLLLLSIDLKCDLPSAYIDVCIGSAQEWSPEN
jgi:hypothetical protein